VGPDEAEDAGVEGDRVIAFGAGTLAAWELAADAHTHRAIARAGLAALAWSADGARVAFGGGDGGVHVLDVERGHVRRTAVTDQVVKSLAFAPDGRSLAVGVATGTGLRVVELDHLAERRGAWLDPGIRVRRLAFLADDEVIAFTYGLVPRAFGLGGDGPREVATVSEPVLDIAAPIRPGAVVALGSRGAVWRYDATGQHRLRDASGAVAVAVSGDGRVLALCFDDGRIELRTVEEDGALGGLVAPGVAIEDAALDHGGGRIALARLDGRVEVWRIADRRLALTVRAHAGRAAAVAFSPDGCTLATAGWDAVVRLLDVCDQPGALQ
jgi:WD40 repeat protein